MRLRFDPFAAADARELAIQRAQRFDLSDDAQAARIEALAAPGRAFAIRDGATNRLIAIAGLAEQAPHYATGWAVLAEGKGAAAMLALTRAVRWFLSRREFAVVDALVHADHRAARVWAARLGFVPEARLRGRAPDGGDMIIYLYQGAG